MIAMQWWWNKSIADKTSFIALWLHTYSFLYLRSLLYVSWNVIQNLSFSCKSGNILGKFTHILKGYTLKNMV